MKKFWDYISQIGCYPELNFEEQRRIKLMNRLSFIAFVVLLIYLFIELLMKVYVFIPGLILMLFLVVITFTLLYYKKYRTAKNFAVILISLCIAFFVLTTGEAFSEALFIPLSVMPLIIFSNKKVSVFYLFYLIILTVILKTIQPHITPLLILEGDQLLFFRIMNIINGIVVTYFITYYFKGANESYEGQLLNMNELISEKNKEITDSINYAKHIQNAILPSQYFLKENFEHSFILYKPKDIVAGDFYWMHVHDQRSTDPSKLIYFAAADCTGHGVPGAMLSVICSNALNRSVNEFGISDPGKILDKTSELVVETFGHGEKNEALDIKDGMDISLCCINNETNQLFWSGANNPLWIIRNNSIIEYKADKQPIGSIDKPKPFTTHTINLQKDDTVFIFTDGYADQFGGTKGKKFKYSQFKELLLKINDRSADEQLSLIDAQLESWKGDLEQVDDILIIGIKI